MLLLSGLFCCLGFWCVCVCVFFLLFGQGRVSFFAVWAGATPLPKQQKIKHAPARTAKTNTTPRSNTKKNHDPLPHPSTPKLDFQQKCEGAPRKGACLLFCCLGGGACFIYFAVWAGGVWSCFIFPVWAGGVFYFFPVWAGACFIFCYLGGGRVLFLLFGRGAFFFAVRAGGVFFCCSGRDGSSLAYRPAWLGSKGPDNKKD